MAKLMIVLNRIVIGGAPADTVQLAGALAREHETCLVSGAKVEDEKDAAYLLSDLKHIRHLEIKSMRRSINPLYDWQAYRELKKIIRSERPDIIHTHGEAGRLTVRRTCYCTYLSRSYFSLLFQQTGEFLFCCRRKMACQEIFGHHRAKRIAKTGDSNSV